ncbi:MAG: RidA family protein, partial [Planctomycetota bacterium]|nr:RidA family protein [Planctomycetota bacterium]
MSAEAQLVKLGITLPPVPKAQGVYKPAVQVGNLVYLSGHGPLLPDGTMVQGCVGGNLDVAAGKDAARLVGLALLATLKDFLGSLDRVKRVVKTLGLVNCTN